MTAGAVRAPLAAHPSAEGRAVLHALATFSGLVTGLFWLAVFAAHALAPGPDDDMPISSVGDYLQAVVFFWILTVLPLLLIPALHAALLAMTEDLVPPRRIRAASVVIALLTWPILLVYARSGWALLTAGVPLAVLLALYGWMQGGFFAPERTTRLDLAISRAGIAVTAMLCALIVGMVAWSWI